MKKPYGKKIWHPDDKEAIILLIAIIERKRWSATMTDDQIRKEFPTISNRIMNRVLSPTADDGVPILKRS